MHNIWRCVCSMPSCQEVQHTLSPVLRIDELANIKPAAILYELPIQLVMYTFDTMYTRPLIALISYGSIVFLYVQALANPLDHIDFIYGFGMFIFIAEFLSIHSSAMLTGLKNIRQAYSLTAFYMIFAVAFSVALGTYYPALILILSITAKSILATTPQIRSAPSSSGITHDSTIVSTAVIFLSTAFAVGLFGWVIAVFIPFPEAVYASKPANASGIFVDMPQTLLAWGILYYSLLIIWQVGGAFRKIMPINKNRMSQKTNP